MFKKFNFLVAYLTVLYTLSTILFAADYTNTSFYVAYDNADTTQFALVLPSVNKVYTHKAGLIQPADLTQVDGEFASFPTYDNGELCFPALKDGSTGDGGASKMEGNCYVVNFFYIQKETISEGTVFMLYYNPLDRVYEGYAGDSDSFKVVKDGDIITNENSITEDDYTNFNFDSVTVSATVTNTLESLISGQTKYFANTQGATGFRTYAEDGTYTGSVTLADGTTYATSGIYNIIDNVLTINRTTPAATLVLTYLGEEAGGLGFNITVNGGEVFQTISFATEAERDAYVTGTLESLIVGQTKYFANTQGDTGFRNYSADGTFTGSVTLANGTTFATSGTYNIVGDVLTINRTTPAAATLVLTYLGEEAGGLGFNITVNGGEVFQTISFATEAERDAYVTGTLESLIVGQTKYFVTSLGATGVRTYATDGTYTASLTLAGGEPFATSGTYEIDGNVLTINRTSPSSAILVLTYLSEEAGGSEFSGTINGGEVFQTISFATEAERDAYVAEFFSTSFVSDVMPIFVDAVKGDCKRCHTTSSNKIFKVGDATYTYDNIIINSLINTTSPDLSSIFIKGNGGDGHNGGDKLSDVNSNIVRDWIVEGGLNN